MFSQPGKQALIDLGETQARSGGGCGGEPFGGQGLPSASLFGRLMIHPDLTRERGRPTETVDHIGESLVHTPMGTLRTYDGQDQTYPMFGVRSVMPKKKPDDYEPDLRTIWGRLEWSRRQWWDRIGQAEGVRNSPRAVAVHFGWPSADTYKSHENGVRSKRGLQPDDTKRYARAFGVDPGWLATGIGRTFLSPEDAEWATLSTEEKATAIKVAKALHGPALSKAG